MPNTGNYAGWNYSQTGSVITWTLPGNSTIVLSDPSQRAREYPNPPRFPVSIDTVTFAPQLAQANSLIAAAFASGGGAAFDVPRAYMSSCGLAFATADLSAGSALTAYRAYLALFSGRDQCFTGTW